MIYLNGNLVTPTVFPDGTSQVWKIPEHFFANTVDNTSLTNVVTWGFQEYSEREFFQLLQLDQI